MATVNQVRSAMHAAPFRPFVVHTADGGQFTVRHPDFISVAVNGLELVIHDDAGMHLVDMDLVTQVHRPAEPARAQSPGETNGE
jgi:hypothetical protein